MISLFIYTKLYRFISFITASDPGTSFRALAAELLTDEIPALFLFKLNLNKVQF
jgi:hypothetical protein